MNVRGINNLSAFQQELNGNYRPNKRKGEHVVRVFDGSDVHWVDYSVVNGDMVKIGSNFGHTNGVRENVGEEVKKVCAELHEEDGA